MTKRGIGGCANTFLPLSSGTYDIEGLILNLKISKIPRSSLTSANLERTYEKFLLMTRNCIGQGTPYAEPVP